MLKAYAVHGSDNKKMWNLVFAESLIESKSIAKRYAVSCRGEKLIDIHSERFPACDRCANTKGVVMANNDDVIKVFEEMGFRKRIVD